MDNGYNWRDIQRQTGTLADWIAQHASHGEATVLEPFPTARGTYVKHGCPCGGTFYEVVG